MTHSYQIFLKILQEHFGVVIFENEQEDFAISDYIPDSISFIQFIIAIEEEFACELSDDFLDFEILSSAKGFVEKLDFFVASLQDDNSVHGEQPSWTI